MTNIDMKMKMVKKNPKKIFFQTFETSVFLEKCDESIGENQKILSTREVPLGFFIFTLYAFFWLAKKGRK